MAKCPLLKKPCIEHACAWYCRVQGKNPQTGADMDTWGCAITFIPMLQIETSNQVRGVQAATETFRNGLLGAVDEARHRRLE